MRRRTLVKNIVNSALDPIGLEIRSKESWTETAKTASSMALPIAPEPVLPPKTAEVDGDVAAAEPKFTDENWWGYHAPRLRQFRDKHKGERCFIIGNGPSLNLMDLRPLENEITFGLNRIYLLFDKLGWATTYHVTVNRNVIEQWAGEIQAIKSIKFVRWPRAATIGPSPVKAADDVFMLESTPNIGFATLIDQPVWLGATVTYVAMQLAYAMGFTQAILIGVDHHFVTQGEPHKKIISDGPDSDHFHPDYFGKGAAWELPNLEVSELAYTMAKWTYEEGGRQIRDATVGGKLQVFPKVDFEALF